jgi:hypothetical protein
MNKDVKRFQTLVSKLRQTLHPELTSVAGFYNLGIVISFKNGFKAIISPFAPKHGKHYFSMNGILVIQDEDFKNLEKIINNKKFQLDYENGSKVLFSTLNTFSNQAIKKVKQNYEDIYQFELRDLLNTFFNLKLNPRQEFFLYGKDELRPRFSQVKMIKIPKKGIPCRIEDKSALIISFNEHRCIDLNWNGYATKTHIYFGDSFHNVQCSQANSETVSYNSVTKKKTYWKKVLKPGLALKKEKGLPYKKADGFSFILKKDSKGIYSLWDKQGKIQIDHPDLLIRIMTKS